MQSFSEGSTATVSTLTEVENIHQRLSKCNTETMGYLHQIEDKLHKLVNKRTPENQSKEETIPSPNDFVSAVHQELSYYESHIRLMERLLKHLSQIV